MTKYILIIDEKTRVLLRSIVRHQSKTTDDDDESKFLNDLADMLEDLKTSQVNDLTA